MFRHVLIIIVITFYLERVDKFVSFTFSPWMIELVNGVIYQYRQEILKLEV